MSEFDIATQVNARLGAAAARVGMSPAEFLRDGMSGVSTDGTVRVWVDGLGRVQRVRIAPGTVEEGDEERLSVAFAEAAEAASNAIADVLTPDVVRERLRELGDPRWAATPEPLRRPARRTARPTRRTDDDDDVLPDIWDRG